MINKLCDEFPSFLGEGVGKNPMIRVDQVNVNMGKPLDFPSYGWDVEYGHKNVE